MNNNLYIYDCLTEKLRVSDGNFMTIGADEKSTFRVAMFAINGGSFAQREGSCRFFPHGKIESYSLNGLRLASDAIIMPRTLYLLVLAGGCFICWYGTASDLPDFSLYRPQLWYILKDASSDWRGPYSLDEIPEFSKDMPNDALASFQGLDNKAFYLSDVLEVAAYKKTFSANEIPLDRKKRKAQLSYRCPSCWESFSKEKALAIAAHPDLVGDDILGDDAQTRFTPNEMNENGLPLDSMGAPCVDFACPLCHYKLPPFFTQTQQHIFSLVGVPAAGKTYYLAALVHELAQELPREFGVPFRDSDPITNNALNDMSMRLFSAKSPQEAYLGKTRLEGSLYQKVWRHNHFVSMPHPFIYSLNTPAKAYSLVVYDNAGENFEPGRSGEENPGAEHLSVASAIFYLFDPTTNNGFRNLLAGHQDPQLKRDTFTTGRQALLLAETEMRLRTSLNLPPGSRLDVPFALIIGKCDLWKHLLGPEPLLPIVRNGMYLKEHVDANSARLRKFLFNISPNTCTNAEAISDKVRYFAASSLGTSPIEFTDDKTGSTLIGPASGKVKPQRVTDPMIWSLSELEPSLFPSSQKA